MAKFPFNDLHSFKDYVVYVQTYLPDRFPPRQAGGPDDQWTLDLAFEGLRLGLNMAVQEKGERMEFTESRRLVEEAYEAYKVGHIRAGFMKQSWFRNSCKMCRRSDNNSRQMSDKMPTNSMEQIFGEGAFETERKIAGTRPGEETSVRYISFDDPASIPESFDAVTGKVSPPYVKRGGVVLEGTRLELPDGRRFFAVLMNDDLEGWRKQIEQGASELGRATARVLAGDVIVSDGRSYPLSNCKIEFD